MWFIILNPAAGAGKAGKKWPEIEACLQSLGIPYTVHFTSERGHATRLANDAILKGYRRILAVGGDGTNHEVINGIIDQSFCPSQEIKYGLLPIGTGNDWARCYGVSTHIRQRLEALKAEKTVIQDIGQVNYYRDGMPMQRYFANVAGMAYDAYISKEVDSKQRKPAQWQYLAMVAQCIFKYTLLPALLEWEDHRVHDRFYTINVGICPYSGGGMRLVPQALPNDGLLALTYAGPVSKWEVLRQTPRFYNGKILEHPQIHGFQTPGPIRVNHPKGGMPTLLEADGEFLGETPAVFHIIPQALQVVL